jgi:putative RNA 2'-phosphotransferase
LTTDEELSRTISRALRHSPGEYGLALDAEGWVSLSDLVEALKRHGFDGLDGAAISGMIKHSAKQRHEIVGERIRALYGHSTPVDATLGPEEPPEVLLHGTDPGNLDSIMREGLKPMGRVHVHLSDDLPTALAVGSRRSANPTVLTVHARDAWMAGVSFERRGPHVWISDPISAEFIAAHSFQ